MKKIQEMTKEEFLTKWSAADAGDLVASNIKKMWTNQASGYWYAANAGDCDGGDTLLYWFEDEIEDDTRMYVTSLNACI